MWRSRSARTRAREAPSACAYSAALRCGYRACGVASEPGPTHSGDPRRSAAAVEQLGAATVIRSRARKLGRSRGHALVLAGRGTRRDRSAARGAARASSSYRAVNYQDLVELRVAAIGDVRTITARTRAGDRWSVPIATDDVARAQERSTSSTCASARQVPRLLALHPKRSRSRRSR